MITKEQFTKLISEYLVQQKMIDNIEGIIGGRIYDWNIIEYGNTLFETVLSLEFKDDAVDDIYWWLFEKRFNPSLKMWDKEGNKVPTETIDDLYEIVKDRCK